MVVPLDLKSCGPHYVAPTFVRKAAGCMVRCAKEVRRDMLAAI